MLDCLSGAAAHQEQQVHPSAYIAEMTRKVMTTGGLLLHVQSYIGPKQPKRGSVPDLIVDVHVEGSWCIESEE